MNARCCSLVVFSFNPFEMFSMITTQKKISSTHLAQFRMFVYISTDHHGTAVIKINLKYHKIFIACYTTERSSTGFFKFRYTKTYIRWLETRLQTSFKHSIKMIYMRKVDIAYHNIKLIFSLFFSLFLVLHFNQLLISSLIIAFFALEVYVYSFLI